MMAFYTDTYMHHSAQWIIWSLFSVLLAYGILFIGLALLSANPIHFHHPFLLISMGIPPNRQWVINSSGDSQTKTRAVTLLEMSPKLMSECKFRISALPILFLLFWNYLQHMAVSLLCVVQNLKIIQQIRMLWMNEVFEFCFVFKISDITASLALYKSLQKLQTWKQHLIIYLLNCFEVYMNVCLHFT